MISWIGVDLDGTLAKFDGWTDATHIGEPVEPMLARVKGWLGEGKVVKIFTGRAPNEAIDEWCLKHVGKVLPVTNSKDFSMIELWDDRCVHVECNTGRIIG